MATAETLQPDTGFAKQLEDTHTISIHRVNGETVEQMLDILAVEEPLEIRLLHGGDGDRREKNLSVTMRTPGHDFELATGFLLTEGVIADAADILSIHYTSQSASRNSVVVQLATDVTVSVPTLERNFYTTSSCGVCGKASLLALRSVCPAPRENNFAITAEALRSLPHRLRETQQAFDSTGGLHAAALFYANGELDMTREDVGRHNAVDKLIGAAAFSDLLPLRERVLMLSGRASFELLQKAVMAGIPMVASVGAPSSLAVQVAQQFDVTLVGFLRDDHFNIYHGAQRIAC